MPEQPVDVEEDHSIALRDVWSDWIERNTKSGNPGHRDSVLRLLKSLNLSDPNILEVGCANGWLCADLACFGNVTGIDLADRAIANAKIRYPNATFLSGDFLTFDLPNGCFDVVVSVGVIPYVHDQKLFVDKVSAILKPRGYLILICANKFIWDRTCFVRQLNDEVPVKWLYMRELKSLLRRRFVVRQSKTVIPGGDLGILRLVNSNKLDKTVTRIIHPYRLTRFKERIGLGKSLVVLAQKRA
jgi:2-polyprenyl-3-methyl-5-hydroxy-6-metoxy-1,4-benzoquinol methylase